MKIFRTILFLSILLSNMELSIAQRANYSYYFTDPNLQSLTVPFDFLNNVIVLPVVINDSDTMRFILDTGVKTAIITDLPEEEASKFQLMQMESIFGLGMGRPIEAYYSPENYFNIRGLKRKHLIALILQEDIFELSQEVGMKIHGMVGYDLFKDLIVEINYCEKKITFHDPKYYKQKKQRKAITLPLEIINSKPYICTKVTLDNDSVVPVKLLVDTGASLAMWLSVESQNQLVFPKVSVEDYIGKGLNGEIHGKKGRINSLNIGNYELKNVIAAFPDSIAVIKTIQQEGRNGSIGQEVLRRFNVTFDYPNKQITFVPNQHLKEKFRFNMSGLTLSNIVPGEPIFMITEVRKGSPADQAGLLENDILFSMNFMQFQDLNLSEINYILQSKEGKKILISVMRNGEKFKTSFVLREDI